MQQQPSAQGIASIYRGNPQPLQQRIQTDQKANPGLPPDLQKMLALQIVTNEKDGFAAQKAMQQLQQMSGGAPGGQPPTVMQTLEAQARQKAMTQAPEMDAPQDEAPMGIAGSDRVAFEGAEGGIVAFKEGGEGKEEGESASKKDSEGIMKALKFVGGLPIEALKTLVSAPGYGLNRDSAPAAAVTPTTANRQMLNQADAAVRSAPPERKEVAPDRKGIAAAIPAKPAAPAAPVDPNEAAYQKAMGDLSLDRDKRAAEAQARMQAQLGGPDTTQYDKAYAEMEKRKGEFEAPKAGFDGLMEYLGQVAQTGRGKKWYEAGAEGGARVEALNKERKTQQFELAKQQVELMQKKMDAERGYKKELFQMGEAERAAVDKQIDTAVKEYGLNKRQADQLRTELEGRHITGKYQLQAARIGQDGRATLTPNQRAMIADKAKDNVTNELKANMALAMKVGKNPAALAQMVAAETERLLAATEGRTMTSAPGAPSPGGTNQQGWGIKPLQ